MQALSDVVPAIAQQKIEKGGFMILRPDSGDPVEAVLDALHAAERVFGVDINQKGFKVPKGCGVIQGDGINIAQLAKILDAVHEENYSAEVGTSIRPSLELPPAPESAERSGKAQSAKL